MIVVPFVYFILLAAYFFYKTKRWGIDVAATSILVVVCFFSIVIDAKDLYNNFGVNENNTNLFTIFLFCLQWTVVLLPLHIIGSVPLKPHDPVKTPLLYIMFILIAGSSIIMIMAGAEKIRDAIIMDMADVYSEHAKDLMVGADGGSNWWLLFPNILVSNPIPTLALFLWFYSRAFMKCNPIVRASLLLASIVQAVLAIVQAGRSAIVYWMFEFYILFCYFYQYLAPSIKRKIIIVASSIGIGITILFVTITMSRFDGMEADRDPLESVYCYAGQEVNNFSTMIVKGENSPVQFDRVFPLMSKVLLNQDFDLMEHYMKTNTWVNAMVNVFDTFGGEIYLDLGWIGYIMLLLLFMILCVYLRQKWKEVEFHQSFFVVILLAFFTKGIFAWPFVGHYTTFALILMLIAVYCFKYKFVV